MYSVSIFLEHLSGNQKNVVADTQYHLDCYAKEGLRTLCFTKKVRGEEYEQRRACFVSCICNSSLFLTCAPQVVSAKDYDVWSMRRQSAKAAIDGREQLIMDTAVQLETNLTLLGNNPSIRAPVKHTSVCKSHVVLQGPQALRTVCRRAFPTPL